MEQATCQEDSKAICSNRSAKISTSCILTLLPILIQVQNLFGAIGKAYMYQFSENHPQCHDSNMKSFNCVSTNQSSWSRDFSCGCSINTQFESHAQVWVYNHTAYCWVTCLTQKAWLDLYKQGLWKLSTTLKRACQMLALAQIHCFIPSSRELQGMHASMMFL